MIISDMHAKLYITGNTCAIYNPVSEHTNNNVLLYMMLNHHMDMLTI